MMAYFKKKAQSSNISALKKKKNMPHVCLIKKQMKPKNGGLIFITFEQSPPGYPSMMEIISFCLLHFFQIVELLHCWNVTWQKL